MSLVQDVKTRIDIVDLISDYVPLQKSGRNLKANCPFHGERTPSFIVFPDRQTWRCFGACATGGDVIAFLMRVENQDFVEALNTLAQRVGVEIPSRQPIDQENTIHRVNNDARAFFVAQMNSGIGDEALNYTNGRGIDKSTREQFYLGFSPNRQDALIRHLTQIGYSEDQMLESGLAIRSGSGKMRDLFRNRLMFPIMDTSSQCVGFGARSLDDSTPKYINTPRTPVFDKSKLLYGLSLSRESIKTTSTVIVVEGYMDVIAAHQHGFQNVVASMGTALTEQQVASMKSVASNFILALDPDNAGREATIRSLESSWKVFERRAIRSGGRNSVLFYERQPHNSLMVATLPQGKDPDSLIRHDLKAWQDIISEARPLMDYLLEIVSSRFNLSSPQGKLEATEALAPFVTAMENPYDREHYFHLLAKVLGVSQSALEATIGRPQARRPQNRIRNQPKQQIYQAAIDVNHRDLLEEYCISLLLEYPDLVDHGRQIPSTYFGLSENRDIFTKWSSCDTMDALVEALPPALKEHVSLITSTEQPPLDKKERQIALSRVVGRLKERLFKEQNEAAMEKLQEADWTDMNSLASSLEEVQEIGSRLRKLFSDSEVNGQ